MVKVQKIEEIDGIGKVTAEKLNTLGIRTNEDFQNYGFDIMGVKYLSASQISKIYASCGQEVSEKQIKEYRAKMNKNNIPRTPVTKEKKTQVKFVPRTNDEFNLNNVERVMFSDGVNEWWFSGFYNGKEMPIVEELNATDLENVLLDAFPNHESDDIVDDAFKKMGFELDYEDSEDYVLCEECKKNLISVDDDDYLNTNDGRVCTECIEEEGGYVEAVALHKAFGIPYERMKYAGHQHYGVLEVIEVNDFGDDDAEYAVGTDDEADDAVREDIEQSICYFNPEFIARHLDIDEGEIERIIERYNEESNLRDELEELIGDVDVLESDLEEEDLDEHERKEYEDDLKEKKERIDEIKNNMESDPDDECWYDDYQDEIYGEIGGYVEGAEDILYGSSYWSLSEEIAKKLCAEGDEQKLIYALQNFEDFVDDAIDEDGRGHFLSSYDGEETEVEVNGETYYIYRTN